MLKKIYLILFKLFNSALNCDFKTLIHFDLRKYLLCFFLFYSLYPISTSISFNNDNKKLWN